MKKQQQRALKSDRFIVAFTLVSLHHPTLTLVSNVSLHSGVLVQIQCVNTAKNYSEDWMYSV